MVTTGHPPTMVPMSSNGSSPVPRNGALLSAVPLLALGLDKPHIIDGSIARRAGDVDFIGLGWVVMRRRMTKSLNKIDNT